MSQFNVSDTVSGLLTQLVGDISAGGVPSKLQLAPTAPLKVQQAGSTDPATDQLITQLLLTVSSNSLNSAFELQSEVFWLENGVATTTTIGNVTKDVIEYDVVYRGVRNGVDNNPPLATDSLDRNYKKHIDGASCVINEAWITVIQNKNFVAATTQLQATVSGNNTSLVQPLQKNTDGTISPFAGGNLIGASVLGEAIGNVDTYKTWNGTLDVSSLGKSGVAGEDAYADYTDATDAVTKAASDSLTANAVPIGQFDTDDIVILTKVEPAAVPVPPEALESEFYAIESMSKPDAFCIQGQPLLASVGGGTTTIGNAANVEKKAIEIVGNGETINEIILSLSKTGSPVDNLTIRIETDNAGEPSGILSDANATGVIAGGTLTTSPVDTTVTFAGAFSLSDTTRHWVVLARSGGVDGSNYYKAGVVATGTAFYSPMRYDGSVWVAKVSSAMAFEMAGLRDVASKADTSNAYTTTVLGFVDTEVVDDGSFTGIIGGVQDGFTALVAGNEYYLSDTPGEIQLTAGAISVIVAKSIEDTKVIIKQ